MIDKVIRLEANRSLVAVKNVAMSEDVFTDHFLANPIMPGALQIESLAQAATVLLEVSHKFKYKALLIMVDKAKFRGLVRPGDQLKIEVKIISDDNNLIQTSGSITVNDTRVTDSRMLFSLQPIDEYYSPKLNFMVQAMYENFLREAELRGIDHTWGELFWRKGE